MHEPVRRHGFPLLVPELAFIEPVAENPEAQARLVLDAEVIAGQHLAVLLPPFHGDALRPFHPHHHVIGAAPGEMMRRTVGHGRKGNLDRLGPREQTKRPQRRLAFGARGPGGLCGRGERLLRGCGQHRAFGDVCFLGEMHDHEATIVGAFPVIAGALVQRVKGNDPIAPDPTASHAADTLSMMLGRKPDAREVAALDAYFVTVCDHGMNASTFTTRVIASTHADLFASVTGGYCALTGPLHGGAPEPVLEMLDAIGSRERIKPWVDSALKRGERLMGFGHRVYRVRDPRADVLKGAIERFAGGGMDLPFASEVEAYIRAALKKKNPDRPLDTNVEFFTAILLDALKIPRQAFTPIFAVARAAGRTAHAREQQRGGRLIRPSSAYIGPMPA